MGLVLVLAGSHSQYLDWMRNVYGRAARVRSAPRLVARPEDLYGVSADGIDAFHQVGTYWENPAWGCDEYGVLMEEGLHANKAWAMSWTTDFTKACALREPVTTEQFMDARRRLVTLMGELSDGD